MNDDFQHLGEIFKKRNAAARVKPPTYEWQDLALRVINEIGAPGFKRSAVFKACKENSKAIIELALNDTKELCHTGQKWKYFFKILSAPAEKNSDENKNKA